MRRGAGADETAGPPGTKPGGRDPGCEVAGAAALVVVCAGAGGGTATTGGAAGALTGAGANGLCGGAGRAAGGATATTGRCGGGAALTAGVAAGTGRRAACWSRSACSLRSWMARRTSPGFLTPDRSIFGRSPLPFPLSWRTGELPRLPRWKCRRTRSASSPSSELEWVFFSLTPTSSRTSRMARLFTSSSRAKSLIRTLLIRPFYGDYPTPTLSFA